MSLARFGASCFGRGNGDVTVVLAAVTIVFAALVVLFIAAILG
jgi:hypothetical protein